MVLPPAKFYGRDLPRPRYFDEGNKNSVRVEPPAGVNSALLAWAAEASWDMGGLNMKKRRRAPSRIEGRVDKLRTMAKRARRVEAKEAKASRRGRITKKSALGKGAAVTLEAEEDDMFVDSEDEEEAQAEEQTLRRRLMVEDDEEEGDEEGEEEEDEEEDVRDAVDGAADTADEEEDAAVTPLPPLTRGSRNSKAASKGPPRAGRVKTEPVLAPLKGRRPAHQRILLGTAVQPTKMGRKASASSSNRPTKGPGADPFVFTSNSPQTAKGSRSRAKRTPDLITPKGRVAGAAQGRNGRRTRRQVGLGAEEQRSSDSISSGFSDSPLQAAEDSSSESESLRPRLLEPELDAVAEGPGSPRPFSDGESNDRKSARSAAGGPRGNSHNTRSSPKDSTALGSRVRRRLA